MANTERFEIPKPAEGDNVSDEFFRLQDALDIIDAALWVLKQTADGKAPAAHVHAMADITGLTAALAGKMAANRTFALDDLVDVEGAEAAAIGYVLAKASTGFMPMSALAVLGEHSHTMAEVAGLVAALALKADAAQVSAALGDPWGLQPIGVPIPLFTNVSGVAEPPTDQAYRYIKLTASDAYNTGILTSETVSGSAPELLATAVVDLAGSPLNGETIHLLNTMRVFLRPGSAGTVEGSQNRGHTHSGTTSPHSHSVPSKGREYYQGGGSVYGSTNGFDYSSSSNPMTTSSVSVAFTTDSSGGNEARPRNIGVTYYMRIK